MTRLAVPDLADWCAVDLADDQGRLRRIAIAHRDPDREAWAWDLERRFPAEPGEHRGRYRVFTSGEPLFLPEITPEIITRTGLDAEYVRLARELSPTSYIGVPLAAHGETFGVLGLLTSANDRRLDADDLRIAMELGRLAGVAIDNSRRHRHAVESANMLNAMLAASPVGHAFVDRELRYVHVNPTLAALHGLPVEAHLGRPLREVLPAWAPTLEPIFAEVLAAETAVLGRELRLPARDGGVLELQVNCFPVRDAAGEVRWVGVTKTDITRERQAERAVRASEARLRRVVESPLIAIGFWDLDGRVTGANRTLADLLGYTLDEIADGAVRWDRNLTPPEFEHLDRQAAREVQESGVSRPYEKELFRKDGSRVPVLAGGTRLDEDGQTGVFFMLDLTDRRRIEEQMQAAQRLEAVGRLAGGVAHEINNALQGVVGFTAFVLQRLERDHPARSDAEQVQRAGERAAAITQQLLAYSRRQVLHPVDVDLNDVLRGVRPMLRQALGADRELVIEPAAAPAVVHADPAQLEQVLLNLTLNARDATSSGGRLEIGVALRRITGRLDAPGGMGSIEPGQYVELRVADDGVGMPADVRARVFEPFFTTKPVGQGTGLGLSVVHGIVRQSGGQVWLESQPGIGTTFRVLLPAVEGRPVRASGARETPGPLEPADERTVLLVDDEPMIRAFAGAVLREAGYHIVEAMDGATALQQFEARSRRGQRIDLVLTDIVMPGVGGGTLGEELARRAPEVPVLYTSGFSGDEVVRRGLMRAGSAFLQKPFTPEKLLECVAKFAARRS